MAVQGKSTLATEQKHMPAKATSKQDSKGHPGHEHLTYSANQASVTVTKLTTPQVQQRQRSAASATRLLDGSTRS